MAAGLTEGRVVLVRGEPVDQIALRDHVLVLQRQGAKLAEANPLADRMAVVAGEIGELAANSTQTAGRIQTVSNEVINAVDELAEESGKMLELIATPYAI